MKSQFEKIFVINLKIRPDRLESLFRRLPIQLSDAKPWPAVHGDTVRPPDFWKSGNGAWGCLRSHMQILEHAMQEGLESYLVIEDDALFTEDFEEVFPGLMDSLPNDWEQLYLGGQLLHEIKNPPVRVNEHIYIPFNVNRTHAFAVHARGYRKLYNHLFGFPYADGDHIDHHLGRLHEKRGVNVYVPRRWIVGQAEGSSNISGRLRNKPDYWVDPEACARDHWLFRNPICVVLEAPPDVAESLRLQGWHFGNWLNDEGLDRGVCEAITHFYPEIALREWYFWVQREVVRDDLVIPVLYHPRINAELVSQFAFARFVYIKAESAGSAISQLRAQVKV